MTEEDKDLLRITSLSMELRKLLIQESVYTILGALRATTILMYEESIRSGMYQGYENNEAVIKDIEDFFDTMKKQLLRRLGHARG